MATIIQKPDTLSLSRNLKELIISTSSEISLQLLKGDSMLLEETYLPDVNNRVHVNLADIVTSSLSLTMPSGDAVSTFQSSVYSGFTVKVDGTSVAEFTAVRSGIERFSDTAANFLTANWLTWQPQVKEVLHDQPEWLTYYPASGSCACYARFYYTDGTSGEKKVCDVSQCVSINTRFSKLWALDESGKERYGVIDVYIKDAQGLRLTYVQRYVLCSQGALDEVYLCENSLGGLDTFRFYGDRKLVPEIGYTSLLLDNSYTAADPDLSRKWSQNTGMLTGRECEWCWELFRSSAAYHLYRGTILPIVLDASSVEKSAMSVLAAYSFDYRYASDLGLLNVVRSENLPEVVEISGPDAEVFFLTPRLNEFPSAVLSDDLIIPVQSPYEESWYTLSVGGLKSALLSSVETIYGPMWHVHDNLQVLNLLSADEKGNLLYNGLAVGSGIVGAHDHHGETIRPSVLVIPTTAPSVDSDLRPGEYAMYLDSSSAVDGETPTKAGLDEEELWSILGDSGTEKISKQHLPSDTVYSEDLDDCIKISDLNTLDLVTLSTAQTITGKKTFSEDVVLGGQREDGSFAKAYIPSTAGAGLYFLVMDSSSAVDGETPTKAGLDEEELWAILSGNAGTEVVAKQHLPSDTVYSDGLAQTLLPYATQEWVAGSYMTTNTVQNITASKTVIGEPWAVRMSVDTSNSVDGFIWKNVSGSQIAGLTYHNTARRIFINANSSDVTNIWEDAAGKYSLRVGWDELTYNSYPIMRSDNIGSYALTPSNYTSTLDSRYVRKAGDTMTGLLRLNGGISIKGDESNNITSVKNGEGSITTNRPNSLAAIRHALSFKWYDTDWQIGNIRADSVQSMGFGITSGNSNLVFRVNTSGGWLNGNTIWHSGNDGSGSGLDADLLDGYDESSFLRSRYANNVDFNTLISSGVYRLSYTTDNGASNGPGGNEFGQMLVLRGGADTIAQLAFGYMSSSRPMFRQGNPPNVGGPGSWTQWFTLATTLDNVASATKLQTARSLWGNSFDGGQNLTGRIWAYNGINIGSLDDYGWYISGAENRIAAGARVARDVNVGSLLVSSAWADYTKVPTNGIYSKGAVVIDGMLTAGGNVIAYSSSSRLVKDILPAVSYSRRLMSLGRVVEFRYNDLIDRDRDIHTGLLYENVRDIMPSMCFMHEGYGALNYLDTDYINLVAGAVQENIDDIAYLKNRVASLEMEVERLRRGLAA